MYQIDYKVDSIDCFESFLQEMLYYLYRLGMLYIYVYQF